MKNQLPSKLLPYGILYNNTLKNNHFTVIDTTYINVNKFVALDNYLKWFNQFGLNLNHLLPYTQ